MSTLKVNSIQHPSSSTPAITLDSTGAMTGSFPYPNRNLLYNGAMQVAQRGTSTASITSAGYYTADRWLQEHATLGTVTQSVESDAPTGSGLRNSLKVLFTTAKSSPAAGDYLLIGQRLEGQDVQRIAKGTASAQQVTLSFWVKSNVTGTFIAELLDVDTAGLRQVSASYSIAAGDSGNWVKRTITFPADTTGALTNDNGESLRVNFFLGAGSTYTSGTLATSWAAYNAANRAVGQTNLAAATNNYWQITGVQLETGSVATPFEFKSYGQELSQCHRYYWRATPGTNYANYGLARGYSATIASAIINRPVMRVKPSSIDYSNIGVHAPGSVIYAATLTLGESTDTASTVDATVASGLTAGSLYFFSNNNNASGYIGLSAEL